LRKIRVEASDIDFFLVHLAYCINLYKSINLIIPGDQFIIVSWEIILSF
jgi:hypothetical protein